MKDLISRKWLMECEEEGWIKFDTEKDKNKFIHLVRDIAPSAEPDKRLEKIAELVDGTIEHFDREDAMDLLYQIKEVINER